MRRGALAVALLAFVASCGNDGVLCLTEPAAAVRVVLYDGVADTVLQGGGRGEIRDGSYRDSLGVSRRNTDGQPVEYAAGYGRSGTYTLVVERDGFRPVERRNITAPFSECTVATARVDIQMEPE